MAGKITKRIKGGMVVDLGVVNAFLPGSQLDVKTVTDFDQFINMECELKIVKFNEFRQNIVVSRKAVMSTDLNDKKKEFLENLEVGIEIDGIVKNITDQKALIVLYILMDLEKVKDLIDQGIVKTIIIPPIESVNYGRTVGYDIIEHIPPTDVGKISATKIREKMRSEETKTKEV